MKQIDIELSSSAIITSNTITPVDGMEMRLRRADELTRTVCYAVYHSLSNALDNHEEFSGSRTGIFVGLSTGLLEENFSFLSSVRDAGEGFGSPTLFSHSVNSSLTGYISRIFNITGPALTLQSFGLPFLSAVENARLFMLTGLVKRAVVISGVEHSPFLEAASKNKMCRITTALSWTMRITKDHAPQKEQVRIVDVKLEEFQTDGHSLLLRKKEVMKDAEKAFGCHPAYLFSLDKWARNIDSQTGNVLTWEISSCFGCAKIVACKGASNVL